MSYGIEPGTGSALLVSWLARPYDPERTTAALLGLRARAARQLLGTVLATSAEAEHLLSTMPGVVRSLAIATTDRPQRCFGEIRGPVLWAETMSARAASAGDPGLYVCATTTRAYDTDENRVLVAALDLVRRAGHEAEPGLDDATAAGVVRRARHNSQLAARFLDHQALAQVPATRPSPRALRRTRAGSRRSTYQPALALLRRGGEPLGGALVHAMADERTRAQHDLLAATLRRVEEVTGVRPSLRSDGDELVSGVVRFRHPLRPAPDGGPTGIFIGGVVIDVPDRAPAAAGARTGPEQGPTSTPVLQAHGWEDVTRAVERGLS